MTMTEFAGRRREVDVIRITPGSSAGRRPVR
jgi:hypothetical protein